MAVKASAFSRGDWGIKSRASHVSDVKVGILVKALLDTWYCRISAWTVWRGVGTVGLGQIASCICDLGLIVSVT